MKYLHIVTFFAVLISFIFSRKKTFQSLILAIKKMAVIFPTFLGMLISISLILNLVPDSIIIKYLGTDNLLMGNVYAVLLGSITLLPGFIAFP